MKLINMEEAVGTLTLDDMLKERFGINPTDHLIGLSEFTEYLQENPWVMDGEHADLFADKLLETLNLNVEELKAALKHREQWKLKRLQ